MRRATLAVAVLLAPTALVAGPRPREGRAEGIEGEVRSAERRLAITAALARLAPDETLAHELLEAAGRVAALRAQAEADAERILAGQLTTFTAFRDEAARNVGFTKECERRTSEANERGKDRHKRLLDDIAVVEVGVGALLSREQAAWVQAMDGFDGPDAGALVRALLTPGAPQAGREPRTEEGRIRGQLRAIHEDEHGALGPLGRLLVAGETEAVLARHLGVATPTSGPPAAPLGACRCSPCACSPCGCGDARGEVEGLRQEINLLNLVNGLYLDAHQLEHLLVWWEEAEAARAAACEPPVDPAAVPPYLEALAAVTAGLERGDLPGEEALQRLAHRRRDLRPRRPGDPRGATPRRAERRARPPEDLARSARTVLTPAQEEVLAAFKPCLVPPKDLRDPVRVGQAADHEAMGHHLARLRAVPEARYREHRGEVLERVLSGIERHEGTFPPGEREGVLAELGAFLDRVRAMDEMDFELSKQDLGEEARRFSRKGALTARLDEMTGRDRVLEGKVAEFLLAPAAGRVYRERIQALRSPEDLGRADLDAVDPAPHCKDHGCAVDD